MFYRHHAPHPGPSWENNILVDHPTTEIHVYCIYAQRVNADGSVDISDSVQILLFKFVAAATVPCLAAADVNDDAAVDVSDVIFGLNFLFLSGFVRWRCQAVVGLIPKAV